MRSLLLLSLLALSVQALCPDNSVYDSILDRCFTFVSSPASFADASFQCWLMKGHLAVIDSGFQNSEIAAAATSLLPPPVTDVWIGATDLIDSTWMWPDYTPISYSRWAVGEPSPEWHCAAMGVQGFMNGKWHADDCKASKPFVCSVPSRPDPTTPATTTKRTPGTCASGWTYFDNTHSCYKLFPNATDFYAGQDECNKYGFYTVQLASIHSNDEFQFVNSLIGTPAPGTESRTWIGLYLDDEPHEPTQWKWSDASPMDYGTVPDVNFSKECGAFVYNADRHWHWDDFTCDEKHAYVCKYKA